jgi:hypothetical protein
MGTAFYQMEQRLSQAASEMPIRGASTTATEPPNEDHALLVDRRDIVFLD